MVNQVLLAQGIDVTVIDNDVDRIREPAGSGSAFYYGDGARLEDGCGPPGRVRRK